MPSDEASKPEERKIVGLRGNSKFDLPERSEEVIHDLKDLLSRAEAGEILGLLFVSLDRDLGSTAGYCGRINVSLIGRAYTVLTRCAYHFEDDSDADTMAPLKG